jgi:hypothetical protein
LPLPSGWVEKSGRQGSFKSWLRTHQGRSELSGSRWFLTQNPQHDILDIGTDY